MLNIRLAGRVAPLKVMRRVQTVQCCCLLLMLLLQLMGMMTLPLMVVLIAGSVGLNSLVFPIGNQIVLEMFRKNAGTAAALLGASQFCIGAVASVAVAMVNHHGPIGLVATMAGVGMVGYLLLGIGAHLYQKQKSA